MSRHAWTGPFAVSIALFVTASLAAAGCELETAPPARQPTPLAIGSTSSVVRVVPARTPFTVELLTELNSTTGRAGEPFQAQVVTPLESIGGDTVVPADAKLIGYVVAIRLPPPGPAILVRFDLIETRWGARPVRARLAREQPNPSVIGLGPKYDGYDGELERVGGIPMRGDPIGTTETTVPIILPPGVRLQMFLADELAVRAPSSATDAVRVESDSDSVSQ